MIKSLASSCLLLLLFTKALSQSIDTLEFQPGYPDHSPSALTQLKSFPYPRYKQGNDLIRLFNWMNPLYMGGKGQLGISKKLAIETAVFLQEELILHWNYFIFIPNSTFALDRNAVKDPSTPIGSFVKLANKYPEIPLGTTIFWMQLQPKKLGYNQDKPNILLTTHPDKYYVKDNSGSVIKRRLNFAAPDSLFIDDGKMQRQCLENLLSGLTRPITMINENGEEPPGVMPEGMMSEDSDMIADKKKLGIVSWHIYASEKKKHFRQLYSSQFMQLPELKNTWFTVYCLEGGPINRFDWNSTKKTCSLIKGNYYSTPDFYPRYPNNWRTWKGAWHGWKWINDGRKIEIKNGDRFFSPFIAAGWSKNASEDMRPGQWLGLLKCMSVIGAEFYYVAYFNLKAPFTKPSDYVWQAVIPAYAQAITTRYEDIFRNGNVMKDEKGEPVVTYPLNDKTERDILVSVRKHNTKEQYIIAATLQPESNTERIALKRQTEIGIADEKYIIDARRQGSVYFLDRSVKPYIFYQLDRWHQYEHPMRWRKEQIYEAEVNDTSSGDIKVVSAYKTEGKTLDFSLSETILLMNKSQWIGFYPDLKISGEKIYLKILFRSDVNVNGTVAIGDWKATFKNMKQNHWATVEIPASVKVGNQLIKIISDSNWMAIDKICLTEKDTDPDLQGY
ncbi:MAG: hypothetical protein K0Q95_486 [Bacteroidota bacterium]|jgi:hypothetical protein|nr:hypothetical protein [Bacteroidota bacterium]